MNQKAERRAEARPKQEHTTVEEMLARMRAGTKEVYEIRMREQVFPVRVLSMDEVTAIRREGFADQAKRGGDETDRNVAIQKCTLKMASTIQKGGGPLISDKMLSLLSLDEVQFLYNEYVCVLERVNPTLETITPEVFQSLVDALKKSHASARDLSLLQLRAICTAYVDLIQRLESQK